MSSAIKPTALLLTFLLAAGGTSLLASAPMLRVCADPNNLPYSNQQQAGFENQLAQMIARDLGMQVAYTWFPERGAFLRKTLNAGQCDVVMGVPEGMQRVSTTEPYYRSGYVFVSRRDRNYNIHSLDDPRLRQLRIGIHILGDSDRDVPPVRALNNRGIVRNLVGYNIFGNLTEADPAADLIKAVEQGKVDLAVAWGPMAGYFARRSAVPLRISVIDADPRDPSLPMTFDIAIGVRTADQELTQQLNAELERRRPEIRQLLQSYGIPQAALPMVAGY
jgi:quinoprotein dehydrogenase-associated probable ABC transporter substrate-binding protein